ncbi:hypothetical protein UA08_00870 [Talaromyces atroroseus]|uniref:Zn(2)-C6 fungal-type domain-containing protein n=1 Tax=Talaromyces atroroseus TaxID=1441469 RepID=A0A225B425_TALAT|nr:hypothetical protein UA08_00870 [Talaromyces atroroseus]OKL64488.1 hypothetical protein UA08_00870 [Talaromyces atroroseus]
MPGILPMKVIKMGNTSQSRIAQACDRCRSKKIRCDGVRPCCTQCKTVGFECKTSDKLSRRAFPRGYTESLEGRVRSLEAEVRELKNLLDERDEKIEVLSRIHSFNSPRRKACSPQSSTASASAGSIREASQSMTSPREIATSTSEADTVIAFQHSAKLTPFAGPSSVRAFSATLTEKLKTQGVSPSSFSTKALTAFPARNYQRTPQTLKSPPRLVTDQLVNIYLQEWAPLYPVVHRPSILKALDHYLADPSSLKEQPLTVIQLNLIFGIAALSSKSRTHQDPTIFEPNWYSQLESFCGDMSVPVVQCMVLAQMYFLAKGDYQSLNRYRALAIGTIQALGLDRSQGHLALDPLTTETRKKVFWCQYILDRFAAALTGLPLMLLDKQISTELPADIDDENVTTTGFLPGLPDESTRMSSTLALLRAAMVLGKVVETLYPPAAGYEVYMSKVHELSEELDNWKKDLPVHLQLVFLQDKPSTNVTDSRSPLLSLVYYFIRILIHRPAACFGSLNVMSPAMMTLLDERTLSLSLSINRLEVVYLSGLGILWQNTSLKRDSKLVQESRKIVSAVKTQLALESAAVATEFRILSNIINGADSLPSGVSENVVQTSQSRPNVDTSAKMSKAEAPSRRNTISSFNSTQKQPPQLQQRAGSRDQSNGGNVRMDPPHTLNKHKSFDLSSDTTNVDYYPVNPGAARSMSTTDVSKMALSAAEWECILSDLDQGSLNIFNGIYGGQNCAGQAGPFSSVNTTGRNQHQSPSPHVPVMPQPVRLIPHNTSSGSWSASNSSDVSRVHEIASSYPSEDAVGGADHATSIKDYGFPQSLHMVDPVKGIMIPSAEEDLVDLGLFDGWDRSLIT